MNILIDEVKVKVWAIENPVGMERAIATIKIEDLTIAGFRVLENDELHKGGAPFWVAPPSYRSKKGKFHSIFWLADKELWAQIQEKIIKSYEELLEKRPDLKAGADDIPVIEEEESRNPRTHY